MASSDLDVVGPHKPPCGTDSVERSRPAKRPRAWPHEPEVLNVVRLVTALPLDVAADARLLLGGRRRPRQHRVDGRAQVGAGHRMAVARTAIVELPAIDQRPVLIE